MQQHPLECSAQKVPRAMRKRIGQRCPAHRNRGLHRVRNRIEARHRGDVERRGQRQLRIEDGNAHCRRRIATRHLHVGLRIGDHRVTLGFASGARCRRDSDHRQERSAGFAVAAVIADAPAVRQNEVDAFGTVERAAAAQRDDRINAQWFSESGPRFDHGAVGILAEGVIWQNADPFGLESLRQGSDVTDLDDAGIRDEKRALEMKSLRELTGTLDGPTSEHDARARLKFVRNHLQ